MAPATSRQRAPRRQHGVALIEAMVAFLVLSLGMLTVARLQSQLRLNADISRQRSEAVRLGQEEIERLRAFASLAPVAGLNAYDDIASASHAVNAGTGYATQTDYSVDRQVDPMPTLAAKTLTVRVDWTDLSGEPQQIVLATLIAAIDPAFGGALALARSGDTVKGPYGRSIRVPLDAKDLGNGRSAFKPVGNGSVALVADNADGRILGRCNSVDPALPTSALTLSSLGVCDNQGGRLLAGLVRASAAAPPDPAQANEPSPALSVALTLAGGPYPIVPWCAAEAMKTVSYTDAAGLHIAAVPLAALPASLGVAVWTETPDRHARYRCVVYPAANGSWSGRSTVAPVGWSIGIGAADRRVCRYSSDLDASGAIDVNIEHPADYGAAGSALPAQNFLVVSGPAACPVAGPVQIAGQPADVFADLSTASHQP